MGRVSNGKEKLMDAVVELIWTGSYGSTTIDHICEKAGVRKGSFYYFFESKADLAEAALSREWSLRRPELDAIFSPTVPPLERLKKYCAHNHHFQAEIFKKYGCVLGCPLFSLGAEVSTQEDKLQRKLQEILEQKRKYLETAIRDAHATGLINAPDAAQKARTLFAYYQGLATTARIMNNVEIFLDALRGTWDLLGVKQADAIAA
jgi:TetR/AcrR family transcriptional repressor of nem operon